MRLRIPYAAYLSPEGPTCRESQVSVVLYCVSVSNTPTSCNLPCVSVFCLTGLWQVVIVDLLCTYRVPDLPDIDRNLWSYQSLQFSIPNKVAFALRDYLNQF